MADNRERWLAIREAAREPDTPTGRSDTLWRETLWREVSAQLLERSDQPASTHARLSPQSVHDTMSSVASCGTRFIL